MNVILPSSAHIMEKYAGSSSEDGFWYSDEITTILQAAQRLFDVEICQIVLRDKERALGDTNANSNLRGASCNCSTQHDDDLVVIQDANSDALLVSGFSLKADPSVRFYAGARLRMGDVCNGGTLCLIGTRPRSFGSEEQLQLKQLAQLLSSVLVQSQTLRRPDDLQGRVDRLEIQISEQAAALEKAKTLLQITSKTAKLGAWELDCATGHLTWSDGMYALHDLAPGADISTNNLADFYPEDTYEKLSEVIRRSTEKNEPYTFEGEMMTASGASKWVRVTCEVELRNGVAVRRFGTKQDITEQKQAIDKIRQLAETDTLTGLHNRSSLIQRLDDLTDRGVPLALLLLDLDGFKDINDVYGHAAGDFCLKQVADRLASLCRPEDFLARLGGDEFAILIEAVDVQDAASLSEAILVAASTAVEWQGAHLQFSTSIGISCMATAPSSTTDVLQQADLALYRAKSLGRNCVSFFTDGLLQASEQRALTIIAVRHAMEAGRLELFFQAKVPLSPNRETCFEALLRWRRSDGQAVGPDSFRAALDDPQLSIEIGDFVIQAALDQALCWRKANFDFGSIAINIGAGQFRDGFVGDRLIAAINSRDLKPSSIKVEVTEDVLLSASVDTVISVCRQLRAFGVGIAFDDFGTGFASLTHLLEFPITEIKIDRSFVAKLFVQDGTSTVVKAIADLGQSLGMDVVAEGVETREQLEFLKDAGCHYAQGYYFHRPAPASEIGRRANSTMHFHPLTGLC